MNAIPRWRQILLEAIPGGIAHTPDVEPEKPARSPGITGAEMAAMVSEMREDDERERRRRRALRTTAYSARARIMERDGFRCRRCGAGPRDERLVVDHVVPIALGGSSDDSNLQTLCEPCNLGKADRPPHPARSEGSHLMPEGRFLSKSIAWSEQVGSVSLAADYLFTRMIPHLDSAGRIAGSATALKAMVCPLRTELTPAKIDKALDELASAGLVIPLHGRRAAVYAVPGIR